jgi:hypothetical protein
MWKETFCLSMVEAMSANCVCVHSDLAALPEISARLNVMHRYSDDVNEHARVFMESLDYAIQKQLSDNINIRFVKEYADSSYGWNTTILHWKSLIDFIKNA